MWNRKTMISIAMLFGLVCVPAGPAKADEIVSGRELLRAVRDKDAKNSRPPGGIGSPPVISIDISDT